MTQFVYLIPLSRVNISAREMGLLETSFQGHGRTTFPTWTLWPEQLVCLDYYSPASQSVILAGRELS